MNKLGLGIGANDGESGGWRKDERERKKKRGKSEETAASVWRLQGSRDPLDHNHSSSSSRH